MMQVLYSYWGPMDNLMIQNIREEILAPLNVSTKCKLRTRNVLVELAQNIYRHSTDRQQKHGKSQGRGHLIMGIENGQIVLKTINPTSKENAYMIQDFCDSLSKLGHNELRKTKSQRRLEHMQDENGASIGLVVSALVSDAPLGIHIKEDTQDQVDITIESRINMN